MLNIISPTESYFFFAFAVCCIGDRIVHLFWVISRDQVLTKENQFFRTYKINLYVTDIPSESILYFILSRNEKVSVYAAMMILWRPFGISLRPYFKGLRAQLISALRSAITQQSVTIAVVLNSYEISLCSVGPLAT